MRSTKWCHRVTPKFQGHDIFNIKQIYQRRYERHCSSKPKMHLGKQKIYGQERFLPSNAMHKRGLCRHAVSVCVCVSVCLSVCQSHAGIVPKRLHIFSVFSPSGSPTILVFHTKLWMAIFRREPP